MGSLQRAGVRDLSRTARSAVVSRRRSLADKTLGIAERLGHLGAAFMVLSDRIREAAMLGDLPQVEALGPQILDIGERGGLPWRYVGHIYLGLAAHWRGNAERAEAELRNAVELEPPAAFAGQSASLLARHLAYDGRADEVLELFESTRSQSSAAQPRSGQRHRLVERHDRLRRGALPVWPARGGGGAVSTAWQGCSSSARAGSPSTAD